MIISGINNKILKGQIVSIVATGPSLAGFDYSRLQSPLIAVNYAIRYVDNADIIIGLDESFFIAHHLHLLHVSSFKSDAIVITEEKRNIKRPYVHEIAYDLDEPQDTIMNKSNLSGHVALGIAFFLGAKKVYLFGFDTIFESNPHHYALGKKTTESDAYSRKNYLFEFYTGYPIIVVGHSAIAFFKKVSQKCDFYSEKVFDERNNILV